MKPSGPMPAGEARVRPWGPALALAGLLIAVFLGNGRTIGAVDTLVADQVAASLVGEHDFDLDEFQDPKAPYVRTVGGHRLSIWPVLTPLIAAPAFALLGLVLPSDPSALALAGKLVSTFLSVVATVVLFFAMSRRWPVGRCWVAAALFALGTTVWITSLALWHHPATILFVALAILFMVRAEDDGDAWAARAGLPLGLAFAARPAAIALVAVLGVALAARWPRQVPRLVLWSLPGPTFVALYGWFYFGSPLRTGQADPVALFSAPWGEGQLGLLFSPGKGLLVFTPLALVAVVGLVRCLGRTPRFLPLALGTAFVAHLLLVGRFHSWHGGVCWGPRLMTDALPLLFFFLPSGLVALPRVGAVLAALSVGVQALGAFTYESRWEKVHQQKSRIGEVFWQWRDSPIAFQARERCVILARPMLRDDRVVFAERRLVPMGPTGSRITFASGRPRIDGEEPVAGNVCLLGGARIEGGVLNLGGRRNGLVVSVEPAARDRDLELRIRGSGLGPLYVGEQSFGTRNRFASYMMEGAFSIRHRWSGPASGGPHLTITTGRARSVAEIEVVSLVAPDELEP